MQQDKMQMLKSKVSAAHVTQNELAALIGIDPSTLYRKMSTGGAGFTVGEVHKIVDALHLSDKEATDIFLN